MEDGFGTTIWPDRLRQAGFNIECFATHFQKEGRKEEGVKDARMVKYCASRRYVLITTDKNIHRTHVEAVKKTDVCIIATESNQGKGSIGMWVEALIKAKASIERHAKKFPRPSFARLSRSGKLNRKEHITEEKYTRRRRPKEQEEDELS
ncbi:MAG: hypothetical protein ACRD4T_06600 [Candidatus Acidiferrales bacterium]